MHRAVYLWCRMAFVGRRGVTVIEVLCVLAIAVVLLIVVN
ncbi:MAG: prepilin-type N-terminal cleavage/methylation domain-containing protein, partial [Limisphaerales bacterium]